MKKAQWFTILGLCLLMVISLIPLGCQPKAPAEPGAQPKAPAAPTVPAGDPIKINMVSYFPTHLPEMIVPNFFIDKVNEELAGQVVVELIGGPEVIPTTDQAEAVRNGIVDMIMAPGSSFVSTVPEVDALKLATITAMEEREMGSYNLWDRLFMEKANAKYLWVWSSEDEKFALYSKKKLEKADFSGMSIRSIPLYEPLIKALGGTAVSVSIDEIHTAMDRGIIDAFFQPFLGAHTLGWPEIADYVYMPGFYRAEVIGVLNLDVWNSIPAEAQEVIIRISKETEKFAYDWESEFTKESIVEMQKMGIEVVEFSPEEAEKFRSAAYEGGWAKVKERTPDSYDQLRDLLTK